MKRMKTTLSSRVTQNIKRNRAKVSPTDVSAYFDNLVKTVNNIPAGNIINYGATNFTDDPESTKVSVKKGQKHVDRTIDHSKVAYSVMFAGAADGKMLPPYIVHAAVHLYPIWREGGSKGSRYNHTKSGQHLRTGLPQSHLHTATVCRMTIRRKRVVDIQPGESVTAEHAAQILIRQEKLDSDDQLGTSKGESDSDKKKEAKAKCSNDVLKSAGNSRKKDLR
ncbi:uncharacterized protein LOC129765575 [Toxorhynchites rutilus septentrionalis]|uniref:uncharacterized protein LOC129765575 n=1 Tax=Toxorhynchites rutilus septentrionalis TaxID=329112 RepID=UPI0024783540|nr:uncharacterized protein LOC129765575 [Toxorhynchites rutilus septentrionalis]